MRTQAEIQRAHDLLVGVLLGEVPELEPTQRRHKEVLSAAASVLCWILEHDHNVKFPRLLKDLEQAAKEYGYTVRARRPSRSFPE